MRLTDLLRDATESAPSASLRSQQLALTNALNTKHPDDAITLKGVAKWFERASIPGKWLMRIAALPSKPLNLAKYQEPSQ